MTDELGPDDFGTGEPWTITDTIRLAYEIICADDEPWVNADEWPAGDHGHTQCLVIGGLLAEIERLQALVDGTS